MIHRYFWVLVLLMLPFQAFSKPWGQAIAEADRRTQFLMQEAASLGAPNPGNHSIEAIGELHRCAILGRMLDKAHLIELLEKLTIPEPHENMDDEGLVEFSEGIKSLNIWVHVAKELFELNGSEKAKIWNRDCVGSTHYAEDNTAVTIPDDASIRLVAFWGEINDEQIKHALECVLLNADLESNLEEFCVQKTMEACASTPQDEDSCFYKQRALWSAVLQKVYNDLVLEIKASRKLPPCNRSSTDTQCAITPFITLEDLDRLKKSGDVGPFFQCFMISYSPAAIMCETRKIVETITEIYALNGGLSLTPND